MYDKYHEVFNTLGLAKRIKARILPLCVGEVVKCMHTRSFCYTIKEQGTYPCFLLINQFIIRPNGKVSPCCSDALRKMTLGDVSKDTLLEVWFSEDYEKTGRQVFKNIADIESCRYCDSKHKINEYSYDSLMRKRK